METEKELYWEVPQIYHPTISLVKEEEEDQFFENLRKELRKLALSEVDFIKKLTKVDNITPEVDTKLRDHLKRFALIGLIYTKIKDIGYYILKKTLETDNILKSLSDLLSPRMRREGYLKKDITEFLNNINLDTLVKDLEEINQYFRTLKGR